MKQRYISGCEFCDTWFWDQVDCEQHEAEHFNLTRREYLDWRLFHRKAIQTGFNCGCNNNERTKQEFDDAVEALCAFEERHGLVDIKKKPTDFFR